jgi:signal peptidase I
VRARTAKREPGAQAGRIRRELFSWLWVLLAFVLLECTVAQARVIPSGSMENTILVGDHMIVSVAGYDAGIPLTRYHVPLWREPHRQQIIVLRSLFPNSPDLIKRVIGVPGDRIKIVRGQVYLNGARLDEPYARHDPRALDSLLENYPPRDLSVLGSDVPSSWAKYVASHSAAGVLVVPSGNFFVMGDNRDDSYDSRFWGFVPRANVIGTPAFIYMSINAPEEDWESKGVEGRLDAYASAVVHPSEVRWSRLFHGF